VKIILLDRHVQEAGQNTTKEMTAVGKAVEDGIIANETQAFGLLLVTLLLGFTYSYSKLVSTPSVFV
jgi:hypothetical protein